MKWDIWVQPNQIIKEEYPDGWSHQDVMRAADARYGGKVTTVNPSGISSSDVARGGVSAPSSGGGCGTLLWVVVGIIVVGIFGGGGEKENRPSTPPESLSQPQTQVLPKSYANPAGPCVTDNFEPC